MILMKNNQIWVKKTYPTQIGEKCLKIASNEAPSLKIWNNESKSRNPF